jgi:hypothetical protein
MPTKNVTIDNICPLINYSPVGAWQEGDGNDPNSAKSVSVAGHQR